MTRPLVSSALLLGALVAAWQPSKASAADEDTQLWHFVFATGEIRPGTRLTLDASHRWREEARGGDVQTLRFAVDQTVVDDLRLGGGAAVFEAGGTTELRPHQQLIFTRGGFEARTRLEERFFDGADRMELRLRQRLQYIHPLGRGWRAHVGAEWLSLLQSRRADGDAGTELWIAQTGVAYKINDRLDISANYWLLAFPNGDQPARFSHVPQTMLIYHF
jgi:hypothetical protein